MRLEWSGSIGRLVWADVPTPEELRDALVALDALPSAERPRRAEVVLPADGPQALRWLLHRHGFRLEGRSRASLETGDGFVDALHYARLVDDPLESRVRFTAVMNSVTPRKRLIAHALVTDASGRVLLCETSFKPDFELPGGIVEPYESPRAGCEREMVEEMNVALATGRVLVADWLRPYLGWEDALELVFEVPAIGADVAALLRPDGSEIVGLHWVPPPDVDRYMTPFAAARVRAALRAQVEGRTIYTEGGVERSEFD